ncbi:hypothetical protein JCM19301_2339 [Jejuia pallidilutea]|uniref:Uncharacterized protein n=1 Tax=Jejuia pallidilutea TaxID=504487 RepID=A0A090VWY2_9FLAO|nr:hypothetical protein JCM19301_2339 [Jejuia pallidilutea]GAL73448.1 hypothetical protein JCM19302_2378 [Jejuia pallidilutea]
MEIKYPVAFVTAFHEIPDVIETFVAPSKGEESVVQLGITVSVLKLSSEHPRAFPAVLYGVMVTKISV